MEAGRQLILVIQEYGQGRLEDGAICDLLAELAMPLSDKGWDMYPVPLDASLRVEFERTHEWELVLRLSLIGTGFFEKSFCEQLSKQLAQKLIRRLFPDGKGSVRLSRDNDSPSSPPTPALIEEHEAKSIERVEEALGISHMAHVDKMIVRRILTTHIGAMGLKRAIGLEPKTSS